ncbi:DMT family transporter [Alphaproteobacteria bacterium]|nr:DMT family transporter [Alphaproteobacteria bacterium]
MENFLTVQKSLLGIFFMLVGIFLLSTMDALAKYLLEQYGIFQILALRSCVTIGILFFLVSIKKNFVSTIKTSRLKSQILRGICGLSAVFLFFLSLKKIPLADATALFFVSTFFLIILSRIILREQVQVFKWVAVVVGFLGMILIVNPSREINLYSILPVLAAFFYALMMIATRFLSHTESNLTLLLYQSTVTLLISSLFLPFYWVGIGSNILLFILIGFLATFAHLIIIQALRYTSISSLAPYEYTGIIWSVIFGYFIWNEKPLILFWIGSSIIILSGIIIFINEKNIKINKKF